MAKHLFQILETAARNAPHNGSIFYDEEHPQEPICISYPKLLQLAKVRARMLLNNNIVAEGKVILLHFNRHVDYIPWFWSVIAAGGIPTISTPLAADPTAKQRHLSHLQILLKGPKVLTSQRFAHEFLSINGFDIVTVESLLGVDGEPLPGADAPANGVTGRTSSGANQSSVDGSVDSATVEGTELAFLMLTSGSTGHAKAVEERHDRVIASIEGKVSALGTADKDVFLDWIGFDHVASVTEMYLHAALVGALDIHVTPTMLLQNPLLWLELIEKHSVTRAFAPNFFLGAVNAMIEKAKVPVDYDVSSLRTVVSGGEANVVTTGIVFNRNMHSMGAGEKVLVPAFGMTETCGACTYHHSFPDLEELHSLQFSSIGKATNPLRYRVTVDEGVVLGERNTEGGLEIAGPCVFPAYFNDEKNSRASFTNDGWFKTGDNAYIDASGALVLSGRVKDSIILNGVKYFSHELESALEEAGLEGLAPSYTASFSTQPVGSDSEELIIVYLPTEAALNGEQVFTSTMEYIAKTAILYCNKKPLHIIPLPRSSLLKSALGKLSRPKLKKAYEDGQFRQYIQQSNERLASYRVRKRIPPRTRMEMELVDLFAAEFSLDKDEVGASSSLLDVGVDSLALFRFKGHIQKRLRMPDISMTVLLMNPSIASLASAIEKIQTEPTVYNPVVIMQNGNAPVAPLWLIHPGLGEVLVFLNLSKYFSDRKVYGIRAPGFNPQEEHFTSLDHMFDTYVAAIRKKQPRGPYVLLGYSYGGLVAFNTAKRLEALGETVQFCGIMNLPAYVKHYMRQLDWCELFLTLLSFMGFISEKQAADWKAYYHALPRDEVVERVMDAIDPADRKRLLELDLDADKLDKWAAVSTAIQGLARNYDPSGSVACLDVFYAVPSYRISPTGEKKTWLETELMPWSDFSRSPVRYHDSPGTHHTMIDPHNVFVFQKLLKAALKQRQVA